MHFTLATLGLAAVAAAVPAPQVDSPRLPDTSAGPDCSSNYDGQFQIQIVNITSSTKVRRQDSSDDTTLTISLKDGVLTDENGRTGYIAGNSQFQFNQLVQPDAIYSGGFSVCNNGSLAIGSDASWSACLSGTFYNLYENNDAAQCVPVYIQAVPVSGSSGPSATGGVMSDGQPTVTSVASQQSDGQPTAGIVSTTATPVTQITDGQPQAPTSIPEVTQITDGQPQAPTSIPAVTQITDGQPQAPTSIPAVTQITDGQPQAPTSIVSPVTQITDGQPQAPTYIPSGSGYASPSNGTGYSPTASPPFMGAASYQSVSFFGLVAGLVAVVAI